MSPARRQLSNQHALVIDRLKEVLAGHADDRVAGSRSQSVAVLHAIDDPG
jgi:hypothetical protein